MSEHTQNDSSIPQSNFEQLFKKKLSEIEEKVSKYCSQYDALMNLLPIGNKFQSVFSLQKDIESMNMRIDFFNKMIDSVNQIQAPINKIYWQDKISDFKLMNTETKKQIEKIQQSQKEKSLQVQDSQFQQMLSQKVIKYEQMITTKLATYKNKVEKSRHKESKSNYQQVYKSIKQKIDQNLQPYHKKIDNLLEEIQISKLKIPLRDAKDFHDFNHQRLLQEIFELNEKLERFFQILNQSGQNQKRINLQQVEEISSQIESIRYQAIGNRQKFLNYIFLQHNYCNRPENSWIKTEQYINQSFYELEEGLKELKDRLDLILRFVTGS